MTTKERLAELRKHVEIWERLIASDATEVLNELESLLRENEDLKALCFKAGCSHVRPEYLKNLERVAGAAEELTKGNDALRARAEKLEMLVRRANVHEYNGEGYHDKKDCVFCDALSEDGGKED